MIFNSYLFIFLFIPVSFITYHVGNRIKPVIGKLILILASIIFYTHGRTETLKYLGISILINYLFALFIHCKQIKNRFLISIPIIINIGSLMYFKYTDFVIENINSIFSSDHALKNLILPLGISFYTFQQIAYVVSISDGSLNNIRLIDYLTYILYFPKLIMGPLADPVDFINSLNDEKRLKFNIDNFACGIKLFSFGLLKKVLIADTFAKAVSWTYTNLETATAVDCLLLMLFYTFEIYFDFSGYSDMATGVSMIYNLELPINFDSPYKALSIRDFWKRWHVSLTKFLTKYIFIPLGGSRKGSARTYFNILIVFLISGIWHGANWTFILWGILHGILNCFDRAVEKVAEKILKPIRWLLTFISVNMLWLLFSSESVFQWTDILKKAFGLQKISVSDGLINVFRLPEDQFIFDLLHLNYPASHIHGFNLILFTVMAAIICFFPQNNYRAKDKFGPVSLVLAAFAFIWGALCLGTESEFLYFGF